MSTFIPWAVKNSPRSKNGPVLKLGLNFSRGGRLLVMLAACFFLWPQALSASSGAKARAQAYAYFDFPTCVRYALEHSEVFLRNRIDIQIASADLKDAHAQLLPRLEIVTQYYLASAYQLDNPLSIDLYVQDWNPLLALLKIKSNGILVDIGRITHYDKIADNISKMATIFYRIHILEKTIRARKQLLALQQDKVSYGKSRNVQGAMDQLELRVWTNKMKEEHIKLKDLETELLDKMGQLKMLMGYHPDYYLPLDTRDAADQILAGFNGQLVTFPEIQGSNLGLKILAKKEQLQSNLVTGAYVALVPKPVLVLENISNTIDRSNGFNLALGMDYTLWDGFKRVRDIKRQKMKAEQVKIDRNQYSEDLYNKFRNLREKLDLAGEKEVFYREQARLAEMTEEKAFLQYKAGDIPYDQYVEKRLEKVEANIDSIGSLEGRVTSLIDLATIAGGLNKYNAGIRY